MKKIYSILGIMIVVAIIIWTIALNSNSPKATTSSNTSARVAINAITDSVDANTAAAASAIVPSKTVTWSVEGYPKDAGININLLKKTSDSPAIYELVRTIAENTANDGSETFQILETDGPNLFIEVTCSASYQFAQGCSVTSSPISVE